MNILETQRLILRTIKKEDFDILYEKIFSNYNVVQNTFGSSMLSKEQCYDFLNKNANFENKTGLSVIVHKQSNKIIGLGGSLNCSYLNEDDYEIGFILEEESWGKGYAKEVGKAQISQIKNDLNKQRAIALAAKNNIGSIKTLESLGFNLTSEIETKRGERLVFVLNF